MSIQWFNSAKKYNYLCGGVGQVKDAVKKQMSENKAAFLLIRLFLHSVLFVTYTLAEVIIFLALLDHGIDLERV